MYDFFVKDEVEEIKRNVRFLLDSLEYSFLMAPDFGLKHKFLDKPSNKVEAIVKSEICEKIAEFEPRCEVDEIEFIYQKEQVNINIILLINGERVNV